MRGIPYPELSPMLTKAILMEVYHQRYEDIDNIPVKDAMFLLHYYDAREEYRNQLIKKEEEKLKRRSRR